MNKHFIGEEEIIEDYCKDNKETKKLLERFLKQKKELYARFVTERQTGYGVAAESGLGVADV